MTSSATMTMRTEELLTDPTVPTYVPGLALRGRYHLDLYLERAHFDLYLPKHHKDLYLSGGE